MARAIDQFLAAIRQAVYGKDVREAIASGIEQCYNDSTASAQKADIEAKGAEVLASIPDTYEALQSDVSSLKSAVAFNNVNVFNGTISKDVSIVKGSWQTGAEIAVVKGHAYTINVLFPNQLAASFYTSVEVSGTAIASKTFGVQTTGGELTFTAVSDAVAEFKYLTNDSANTQYTLSVASSGNLEQKVDKLNDFINKGVEIIDETLTIETANQLNDIPCNIVSGRSYQCVVTSTADGNRFRYSNDNESAWIESMIQHKLDGYIFNFIAAFDADTFSVYTTTTATAHVVLYERRENIPSQSLRNHDAVFYAGDTKNNGGAYICNAVSLDDGTIIAARGDGTIVKIGLDGVETQIADFDTADAHCRLMFFDRNGNLYVSPASFSRNNFVNAGLYRMAKGTFTFTKVLSLYNNSTATDSTIWTMTEDESGNLYAGEYSIANANPKVYKSSNGGTTWSLIYNFTDILPDGRHIHWIEYSPWHKALYCIVGEVNTVLKSVDGGATWTNLNVALSNGKGCGAITTPNGIIIGSDSDSVLTFHRLENDDQTARLIGKFWANMCFSIRRNNLTGDLYAFGDIDVSAREAVNYPPLSVLSLSDPMMGVEQWHSDLVSQYGSTLGDAYYNKWLKYYNATKDKYPDDAIVPHHYGVFISRDGGLTFDVLKKFETSEAGGINNAGLFFNGECMCGVNGGVDAPVIISTGRQKYVSGGCDFDGQVFVRTNASTTNALI